MQIYLDWSLSANSLLRWWKEMLVAIGTHKRHCRYRHVAAAMSEMRNRWGTLDHIGIEKPTDKARTKGYNGPFNCQKCGRKIND
jgi:5-methylcytosine-specific restriction endonuclease McrA